MTSAPRQQCRHRRYGPCRDCRSEDIVTGTGGLFPEIPEAYSSACPENLGSAVERFIRDVDTQAQAERGQQPRGSALSNGYSQPGQNSRNRPNGTNGSGPRTNGFQGQEASSQSRANPAADARTPASGSGRIPTQAAEARDLTQEQRLARYMELQRRWRAEQEKGLGQNGDECSRDRA